MLAKYLGALPTLPLPSPFPSLLSLTSSFPLSPSRFHSLPSQPFPKIQLGIVGLWGSAVSSPAKSGAEPGPQTHFDGFMVLKTHLVTQFFGRLRATQMTVL